MEAAMAMGPRRARIATGLCLAALAFGSCGDESEPPSAPESEQGSAKPDAVTTTEATEVTKPAKPQTLRLLDDGNPTVFVKLGEKVDLYDKPGGGVVETVGHS